MDVDKEMLPVRREDPPNAGDVMTLRPGSDPVEAMDRWPAVVPGSGPAGCWAMPARMSSLRILRGLLRGWLARVSWPRAAGEDVVQAVHAAVGNAVAHAGLDPDEMVDVSIWVTTGPDRIRQHGHRRVVARVRDHGRWRPHAAGRGLALMQTLMDRVRIEGHLPPGGTEVTLISPAARTAVPRARSTGRGSRCWRPRSPRSP